jgi:hypothetical protein
VPAAAPPCAASIGDVGEAAQLAALVTAHARVIDQLLIESDIRARAAKTAQLAVLDPQRGYVARTVAEEEAA